MVVIVTTMVSCKKLEEFNNNPKLATEVPSGTLFANATKNLVDQETTPSVNLNVFRAFAQYWTETTYIDESRYDVLNRKIPDNEFLTIYRDVLNDLKEAKRIVSVETDVISSAAEKKNKTAITEILTVYTFHRLLDVFGNVPYDDALDINNLAPKYDDAKTVYGKLFSRLDAAIGDLNVAEESFGDADLVYSGDVTKWKRFAYSLKLKMAMSVADVPELDPAGKVASAVAGGVFTSAAHDAIFHYMDASPNTNPVWVQLVASGRYDWVPANTIVDMMNYLNDPRRPYYFDDNKKDGLGNTIYVGGTYGSPNTYANYTHITPTLQEATREAKLIDYTEVQFYLAEAVERGFTGGSAETYYNAGITSSILYWGGSATDVATYLLNPAVAYATAAGSYKEKIAVQAWLAYYDRGLLGWTTWRRLDAPVFNPPSTMTLADIPTRFTYPIGEQTLNGTNYKAAASAIGGDKLTTKLFWDKY